MDPLLKLKTIRRYPVQSCTVHVLSLPTVAQRMRHSLELGNGPARPCSPESGDDKAVGDPGRVPRDEGIVSQEGSKSPNCDDLGSREATS